MVGELEGHINLNGFGGGRKGFDGRGGDISSLLAGPGVLEGSGRDRDLERTVAPKIPQSAI